jgi:4-diphosphocytidyl-2-C-methyl-D-erythritol kinase
MIKLYSYGKINLFLDIESKLNNGYHLIKTIMQSIDLHDELLIEETSDNIIKLECNDNFIPIDSKNICYKAAELIKNKYNINKGIKIIINKNIPAGAGLAGGSGNSAATIIGLNELWKLNMSNEEMLKIGLEIGADVPFCILGGTYLAEGIGENLTRLNNFIWDNILIVKPPFSMSTAFVYNNLTSQNYNLYNISSMLQYIENYKYTNTASSTANALEKAVSELHPEIIIIKDIMYRFNALSSAMTGSGSAIFGLFPDKQSLNQSYQSLISKYPQTYKTKTMHKGISLNK